MNFRARASRRAALRLSAAGLALPLAVSASHRVSHAQATPLPMQGDAMSPEQQLAIMNLTLNTLAAGAIPGALVGVWSPGHGETLIAAGISDLATAAPVTLDQHVRIASNTKTFVGTLILQLVDDGSLSLDDRLEGFITGIPNGAEITIRQLLNMTAGIWDFVEAPIVAVDYAANPLLPFTPKDAVNLVREHGEANFAPGTELRYCNTNYILLGLIAEQVAGAPIASLIETNILTPLGLSTTSFPSTPDLPAPFMSGYDTALDGTGVRDVTRSNPDLPWASGAMISTLLDMKAWGEELAAGTLLSPATQAERLTFNTIVSGRVTLGYGLGILSANGLLGHNGGIAGYSSWILHDPASGTTIIVVVNRATIVGGSADPIAFGIAGLLFPDRFPAPAATPTA